MKSVILLGIAAMFLFASSGPAMASRIPEYLLNDCGDCRDHGGDRGEYVCDGESGIIIAEPSEYVAPDAPRWLTRIAFTLLRLTSIR